MKYGLIIILAIVLASCGETVEDSVKVVSEIEEEVKIEKKKDMSKFWNKRYASEEYIYGVDPNHFLKESLDDLKPGDILFPAEGEGRNAVYAAIQGWNVSAFDISSEGKEKAIKLASDNNVSIDYTVVGFGEFDAKPESYDAIALIYAHVPAVDREAYFQKCVAWLKPGGSLILEGFSKKQLGLNSGGPKSLEMLFSLEELKTELKGLTFDERIETKIILSEGAYHQGQGEVVRVIATKWL